MLKSNHLVDIIIHKLNVQIYLKYLIEKIVNAARSNFNKLSFAEKSPSFLARLFRRGKERNSSKRLSRADGSESGESSLSTFSAQFPPAEWFNPSVTHLHSVGTQTRTSSYSLSTTRVRKLTI